MKIYIVERINEVSCELPEVYRDGKTAIADIKKEYEEVINDRHPNRDSCIWMIDEENFCGDCLIDFYDNRWQWRISEHTI